MGYRLGDIEATRKFSASLSMDALSAAIPQATVEQVLAASGVQTQRERKLNLVLTVFTLIPMNLYTRISIGHVLQKICRGLRYIWPEADYAVAGASARSYRRGQLGVRPLRRMMQQVCRPITTPATQGAFLFGLRPVALDSSVETVADTPANAAVFGRAHGKRGDSAFPQVRVVLLSECGAHTILDAGFWPYPVSERVGARRLLRSIEPGMLVLWDRGLHAYDMIQGVLARGAHVLSRLPAHVKPHRVQTLADGSYLAELYPSNYQRRKAGEHIRVRIIEYTLNDPALPGYGTVHRLLTTLCDAKAYPALDLVCAYHERWEIEILIDELDTHQRLADGPLRSLTPRGVIQELYGLVLAHYAVRTLRHASALQAGVDPDRLSFVHALEVIRDAVPEFQMTVPEQCAQLQQRLLRDIAAVRLPARALRSNPRVVKQKMSNFKLKRPQHAQWPQPTQTFRESITLLI